MGTHKHTDHIGDYPFDAYTGDKPYIFVSYKHEDSPVVFPELRRMHERGYRIWYDEGIDPGNEWPDEVAQALAGCSFFVVFLSKQSVESANVRNEINFAVNSGKPFVAVYIEETDLPNGLELRIGGRQAIMKYRMPDDMYRRKMEKVLPETLRGEPGQARAESPRQKAAPAPKQKKTAQRTMKRPATAAVLILAVLAGAYVLMRGISGRQAADHAPAAQPASQQPSSRTVDKARVLEILDALEERYRVRQQEGDPAAQPRQRPDERITVSIPGFVCTGSIRQKAEKGLYFSESLYYELQDSDRITMVERSRAADLLQELRISTSEIADQQAALIMLGRLLGARLISIGTIVQLRGATTAIMRIYETDTSRIVFSVREKLQGDDWDGLARRMARKFIQQVDAHYPGSDPQTKPPDAA